MQRESIISLTTGQEYRIGVDTAGGMGAGEFEIAALAEYIAGAVLAVLVELF